MAAGGVITVKMHVDVADPERLNALIKAARRDGESTVADLREKLTMANAELAGVRARSEAQAQALAPQLPAPGEQWEWVKGSGRLALILESDPRAVTIQCISNGLPFRWSVARFLREWVEVSEARGDDAPSPVAGSGGGRDGAAPAHQPTPQVGDVWEYPPTYARARITKKKGPSNLFPWSGLTIPEPEAEPEEVGLDPLRDGWHLVRRDGKPWPPAQEPEPVRECQHHDEHMTCYECCEDPAPAAPAGLEPEDDSILEEIFGGPPMVTDDQIDEWEQWVKQGRYLPAVDARALIHRFRRMERQVDGSARHSECMRNGWLEEQRRKEDAERERDTAIVRAEKAEAALARVEQVTAAERAVIEAALEDCLTRESWMDESGSYGKYVEADRRYRAAVRALRDAQEAGQ